MAWNVRIQSPHSTSESLTSVLSLGSPQALDLMPDLGAYEIRINHRLIFEQIFGAMGLPKELLTPILQVVIDCRA